MIQGHGLYQEIYTQITFHSLPRRRGRIHLGGFTWSVASN